MVRTCRSCACQSMVKQGSSIRHRAHNSDGLSSGQHEPCIRCFLQRRSRCVEMDSSSQIPSFSHGRHQRQFASGVIKRKGCDRRAFGSVGSQSSIQTRDTGRFAVQKELGFWNRGKPPVVYSDNLNGAPSTRPGAKVVYLALLVDAEKQQARIQRHCRARPPRTFKQNSQRRRSRVYRLVALVVKYLKLRE